MSQGKREGNRTTYDYDGHGRLLRTRYPSPTTDGVSSTTDGQQSDYEQLTYDAGSNVTQRRLRDGQNVAYSYDALGRLTFKDMPTGASGEFDINYAYDNLGRLTSAADTNPYWNGYTQSFSYDALGRLTLEAGHAYHGSRSHQYDLAGRRTRMSWSDGLDIDYEYLVTGEMKTIREEGATSGVGVLATFLYDNLGRRTNLLLGNGTSTSYAYNSAQRLGAMTIDLAGTTHDLTHDFGYNPASQLVSVTRSNDLYAWTGHGSGTTSSTPNGLNQITSHGRATLTYDGRGNMISDGTRAYTHTADNRLATAPSTNFGYDPLGRLNYNWLNNDGFDYDGLNLVTERSGTVGPIRRRYVHGPGVDEPLVWYEGADTTDRRFLHADERGSIVAVSSAAGAMTNINRYDEYGLPASTNVGRF